MLILLDCRPLQKAGGGSEQTRWVLSCAAGLTAEAGVEWLFLMGKGGDLPLPAGRRIESRRSFWLIARVARKYKADLIMMTDGKVAGRTKVPQCSWISGGSALRSPAGANVLVAVAPEACVVPLSQGERERVKGLMADGKEYFYADVNSVAAGDVINLLKAFSLFKKRQLSNMKLVLAGEGDGDVMKKLDSYKYREDVGMYPKPGWEEAGGAYAVISLMRRDGLGLDVLNAWKAGVPVIAGKAGEAVLQASADDPAVLADGLKTLYKDEALRDGLIGKGALRVSDLSLRQSVLTIWNAIGGN